MIRFLFSLALTLFLAAAVRAEIEFIGILVTSQGNRFALGDTATGKTDWVTQGESFGGYTVRGFEAKNDMIVLVRDGTERRIKLKDDAKVKSSRFEISGAIKFGSDEKIEVDRATLYFDQENVFPLKNGITYKITPRRRDDGTLSFAISIEQMRAENKSERVSAPTVITLPGQRFSVQIEDLGFSFTPR